MAQWEEAVVQASEYVAEDVKLLHLVPAGGCQRYEAGSHLKIRAMAEAGSATRHYSLVGQSTGVDYRIAVRLQPNGRGGSAWMHRLVTGDRVEIQQPSNHFPLAPGRPRYLLVAGGIGITPLVAMASTLRELGADYSLVYAGMRRATMPFLAELSREHGDRLVLAISDEGSQLEVPRLLSDVARGTEVYLCGPIGLQEAVRDEWAALGHSPAALRTETFASSGNFDVEPFSVTVADLGVTVEVDQHTSMLDALRAADVDMMWECLRGECGLCVVDVVEASAEIDHRDVFLSRAQKAESKKICCCVSRAVGGTITVDSGRRVD